MYLQEGTHVVFVKDAAFTETKNGNLAVKLTFGSHLGSETTSWMGTFSTPKAMDYTLKTLKTCGLKKVPDDIATQGAAAFDGRDVEVVIEKTPGNEPGRFFHNVKWVNPIGGKPKAAAPEKISPSAAVARLSQLGVTNHYKAIAAEAQQATGTTQVEADLPW